MRSSPCRFLATLCLTLAFGRALAQAEASVLSAIPADVLVVGVIHDVADGNRTVGQLAALVKAPAPDLLTLAKGLSGIQKGIDESGDMAFVLTAIDAGPKAMILVPIADAADFYTALNAKQPHDGGVVEAQIAGMPALIGTKGSHAVIAPAAEEEALKAFLSAKSPLAGDASLAAWIDASKASVVVTSHGITQLMPKLIEGIRMIQAQMATMAGEQGRVAAEMMDMYVKAFTAAQAEVEQLGVGVRIDATQTVDVVSRTQFKPDGTWARRFADTKPCSADVLAGLPAGPFAFAAGVIAPQGLTRDLMDFSVAMMQSQAKQKLTPGQMQQVVASFTRFMQGVHSFGMRMGASEPGEGLYGDTAMVVKVDDSKLYMNGYEESLATMSALAKETEGPYLPTASCRHVERDGADVLEVTMELDNLESLMQAGGPDPEAMKRILFGPDGTLKHYVVAADTETVVIVYNSIEKLKSVLASVRANKPTMSKDPGVAKVSASLPRGAHGVVYVSVSGYAAMIRQFMAAVPGGQAFEIPTIPECSPIGMAVKASPLGVETHLVIVADVPRTIAETVMKLRDEGRAVLRE